MCPFVGFWKVLVCSAVISSLLGSHCPTFTCKVRGEFAAVEQTPSALFSRGSGRVLGWAALSVQFSLSDTVTGARWFYCALAFLQGLWSSFISSSPSSCVLVQQIGATGITLASHSFLHFPVGCSASPCVKRKILNGGCVSILMLLINSSIRGLFPSRWCGGLLSPSTTPAGTFEGSDLWVSCRRSLVDHEFVGKQGLWVSRRWNKNNRH